MPQIIVSIRFIYFDDMSPKQTFSRTEPPCFIDKLKLMKWLFNFFVGQRGYCLGMVPSNACWCNLQFKVLDVDLDCKGTLQADSVCIIIGEINEWSKFCTHVWVAVKVALWQIVLRAYF